MRRSPAASGEDHPEVELSSGVVLVGDAALSLCDRGPQRRRDRFVAMILRGATLGARNVFNAQCIAPRPGVVLSAFHALALISWHVSHPDIAWRAANFSAIAHAALSCAHQCGQALPSKLLRAGTIAKRWLTTAWPEIDLWNVIGNRGRSGVNSHRNGSGPQGRAEGVGGMALGSCLTA